MSQKINISVVITVFNEEKRIQACLESVNWASEIVLVDDGSTDRTVEIAKKFTDKIYHHKNEGYVEPTRNFAISKATGDWILIIDADETVPESLAKKLQAIALEPNHAACVRLPRKNIIFNKWIQHTGWWPDYNIRFFKKGSVNWPKTIHSKAEVTGLVIDLGPQEEYALVHHNYESISQFLKKLDNYTTVTANEKEAAGKEFHWIQIIQLPMQEFLSRYFARKGYKDGLHGLVLSLLQTFYELIVCLKVWEKKGFPQVTSQDVAKGFEETVNASKKQFMFWWYDKKIGEETTSFKKQLYKIRRKMGL